MGFHNMKSCFKIYTRLVKVIEAPFKQIILRSKIYTYKKQNIEMIEASLK